MRTASSHKPAKPLDAWFSFNGLDPSQWRSKMHEFSTWIDNRLTTPGITLENALRDFASKFTGSLREWFTLLGPYRQLQLIKLPSAEELLGNIYQEFIRDHTLLLTQARNEYFERKCCSF